MVQADISLRIFQVAGISSPAGNSLRSLGTRKLPDGALAVVSDTGTLYRLSKNSSAVPDDSDIVAGRGGGNWIALTQGAEPVSFAWTNKGNLGATPTINWATSRNQKGVLDTNAVLTFQPPADGARLLLKLTQGSGGQTITLPANVQTPGGAAPTLSTGEGDVDVLSLVYDAEEDIYLCVANAGDSGNFS